MKIFIIFLLATVVCFFLRFIFEFLADKSYQYGYDLLAYVFIHFYIITLYVFPILLIITIGTAIFI